MRNWLLSGILVLCLGTIAQADEDTKALTHAVTELTTAVEKRETEWWKPLLGPLAGGLVGFVASILTLLFTDYRARRKRPVLKGITDADKGGMFEVEMRDSSGAAGVNAHVVRHVRLKIRNTGKEAATRCRVVLTGIQKLVGNSWVDVGYHDAVELLWAYGWDEKVIEKDIVHGIDYFVDVCNANSQDNHLNLALVKAPVKYKDIINAEGSYLFAMLIAAENAEPTTVSMRVNWAKNAKTLTIESK
jgi:hypothetical protein